MHSIAEIPRHYSVRRQKKHRKGIDALWQSSLLHVLCAAHRESSISVCLQTDSPLNDCCAHSIILISHWYLPASDHHWWFTSNSSNKKRFSVALVRVLNSGVDLRLLAFLPETFESSTVIRPTTTVGRAQWFLFSFIHRWIIKIVKAFKNWAMPIYWNAHLLEYHAENG